MGSTNRSNEEVTTVRETTKVRRRVRKYGRLGGAHERAAADYDTVEAGLEDYYSGEGETQLQLDSQEVRN